MSGRESMAGFIMPKFIGEMTIPQLEQYLQAQQEQFRKLHPHANRDKALTGNPYYKLDGKKIYCIDCLQRKGNMIDPCPICNRHTTWITESMLNNPAHPNWQEPRFRRHAIADQQQAALSDMADRRATFDDAEGLV